MDFFEKHGHAIISSASLIPENDSTTLFTGSGMQPLVPYLLGEKHPRGTRLADSQKCFRSQDIDEVGDNRHTTFFEMLGNWSLGDYWKEEQLSWFFEFLTKEIGIPKEKLWVTCFNGDEELGLPKDTESADIWRKLGIPENRIRFYGSEKNWWSRSGIPEKMPPGEPGGPDSEVFYEFTQIAHDPKFGAECHPNCDCGRFLEIGNSVFMQYIKKEDNSFGLLPKRNVDFGGGLERITAVSQDMDDIFLVNYDYIIKEIERATNTLYQENMRAYRIIADHIKAAVFLIGDGVVPSNKDQGYFVRRLIRRAIVYLDKLKPVTEARDGRETVFGGVAAASLVAGIVRGYKNQYGYLERKESEIERIITEEERKFVATLKQGLREFKRLSTDTSISGKDAFVLFSTYGFPLEMIVEMANEKNITVDTLSFAEEMGRHQEISRAGAKQKFRGGLADASEKTTMLHTATHLMLAGLRKFLGEHVHQAGSNITAERTRFDFTHPEKVGGNILDMVEQYVHEAISKKCNVVIEQMPKDEAQKKGVEGSFWERYPDVVNVYIVKCRNGVVYSQELCGGPHVKNTGDIKGVFKIVKEEAVSAGIRRVKAVLEPPHQS